MTAEAVWKEFRVRRDLPRTLQEIVVRGLSGRWQSPKRFWALRDVHVSIKEGSVLGVIGHNGAGKSTLLRLLCGLGRPTRGQIRRAGRVSGLLDLGAGFHPDLTGRENLMTGGMLAGLTRAEVRRLEEEIIAFAELEEFIDQAVRTYSSGMYLRLAFSAAIHCDPDILVIDEVLAVGDARFQEKCRDRLRAFRLAGKALVVATHDEAHVRALCDEVVVLEEGRVVLTAPPEAALKRYRELLRERTERRAAELYGRTTSTHVVPDGGQRLGTQEAVIESVRFLDASGAAIRSVITGEHLTVELRYVLPSSLPDLIVGVGVYTDSDVKCFETHLTSAKGTLGPLQPGGTVRCDLGPVHLLPGAYWVNVGLYAPDWQYVCDYHWRMHHLQVTPHGPDDASPSGIVALRPDWSRAEGRPAS